MPGEGLWADLAKSKPDPAKSRGWGRTARVAVGVPALDACAGSPRRTGPKGRYVAATGASGERRLVDRDAKKKKKILRQVLMVVSKWAQKGLAAGEGENCG